jgi:hypothetical protein
MEPTSSLLFNDELEDDDWLPLQQEDAQDSKAVEQFPELLKITSNVLENEIRSSARDINDAGNERGFIDISIDRFWKSFISHCLEEIWNLDAKTQSGK